MPEVYERLCAPGAPFETCSVNVAGTSCTVYRHAPPSLREVLVGSGAFGTRTYLVFEDERLDYRSHLRAVAELARILVSDFGVQKGSRIALAMRNWPEWSVIFWAAVSIGAVAVPLNAWGSAAELRHVISHCEPAVVFLDDDRYQRLERPAASTLGVGGVLVVRGTEVGEGAELVRNRIGECADYGDLPATALPDARLVPDQPAVILYTSGTTGRPRAACASHRNILSNLMSRRFAPARAALRRGASVPSPAPMVLLAPVPLFHVTGCYSYLVPTMANGDTMVLMHRWSPERALELIERESITAVGGVPTMIVQLLASEAFSAQRLKSVGSMTWGGAASGHALVDRINDELPGVVTGNGYGMTETCSLISQITAEDHQARPDSVGVLVPVCESRIVDEEGNEVAGDGVGELWVRGANVVTSYWKDEEGTAERFVDGWLRTGDLARQDDEGFLYIVDRLKDVVIRGGENVACVEVENALLTHPGVVEGAVFGLPHPVLGETVAAWVQVTPEFKGDASVLKATVAGALAAFKVPADIWLDTEPMPRNAAGKVIKSEVRRQALKSRANPL
jgi:long-chain acyl-CoA synthetase